MIQITLNGQSHQLPEPIQLTSLLENIGLKDQPLIIEYNAQALLKKDWSSVLLQEGDYLEIIKLAVGG